MTTGRNCSQIWRSKSFLSKQICHLVICLYVFSEDICAMPDGVFALDSFLIASPNYDGVSIYPVSVNCEVTLKTNKDAFRFTFSDFRVSGLG